MTMMICEKAGTCVTNLCIHQGKHTQYHNCLMECEYKDAKCIPVEAQPVEQSAFRDTCDSLYPGMYRDYVALFCSLSPGHEGEHKAYAAHDLKGEFMASWPQSPMDKIAGNLANDSFYGESESITFKPAEGEDFVLATEALKRWGQACFDAGMKAEQYRRAKTEHGYLKTIIIAALSDLARHSCKCGEEYEWAAECTADDIDAVDKWLTKRGV
jgi:hypothetical protein